MRELGAALALHVLAMLLAVVGVIALAVRSYVLGLGTLSAAVVVFLGGVALLLRRRRAE